MEDSNKKFPLKNNNNILNEEIKQILYRYNRKISWNQGYENINIYTPLQTEDNLKKIDREIKFITEGNYIDKPSLNITKKNRGCFSVYCKIY